MVCVKEKFLAAVADIESARPVNHHYPLLEIMRAITPDRSSTFDRSALNKHHINPSKFREAWAVAYAKETLGMTSTSATYAGVTVSRCRICLKTESSDDFGHFLPDDLQLKIREKLAVFGPHVPAVA